MYIYIYYTHIYISYTHTHIYIDTEILTIILGGDWHATKKTQGLFNTKVEPRKSATARTDGGAEPLHLAATKGAGV